MMKAYYQDKWVEIFHGDCREILPQLDVKVDLVLTDPPYGYNEFGDFTEEEANRFWRDLIYSLENIMVEGCSLYTFTGWKYYCEARLSVKEYLKYLKTLIWDKRTFIGTRGDIKTLTYHNISEPIILAYKNGADITFNLENVRIPTIHNDPRSNPRGKRPGDIINWIAIRNNDEEKVSHKGQKPSGLFGLFISGSSNEDDLILDPFLGSGTTCYCAKKLNRHSIGIEIEEKYCEIAAKRCCQEVMELV